MSLTFDHTISTYSYPLLHLIQLSSERCWTSTDHSSDWCRERNWLDEILESRSDRMVKCDDTQANSWSKQTDRQGGYEAGSTACNTHTHSQSNTNSGTIDSTQPLLKQPVSSFNSKPAPHFHNNITSLSRSVSLYCSHSVKLSFITPIFQQGGCSLVAYPVY